jgi:CRP-like cAMP-binding protein
MIFKGELGKYFETGERIVCQGERGDCMYVIQSGKVEVVREVPGGSVRLAVLEKGDLFGEMALFSDEPRSATVRALGEARVLTIDKRGFLKRVHQDPSLAFRILQKMSERIRALDSEIAQLKSP